MISKRSVWYLLAVFITGCANSSEIGASFFQEGALSVVYSDSITVRTSTIIMDSVETSSATRLLIGNHIDERTGQITCSAYFSLGPASQTATIKEINTDYSRISLVLSYDKYSYFDTTMTHTLSVHRITENMDTRYNAGAYTNSHVAYDAAALGTTTFVPYPHRSDSLEIPLSDELGKQLYELSKSGAEAVLNSTDFLKMIKGLVVLPDTATSASILGFSTNPELRLYYIDKTSRPVDEKYLSFSVTSSGNTTRYFNAIKGNSKATRLASLLTRRNGILSRLTDDEAYLQGGTALQIRLEMP